MARPACDARYIVFVAASIDPAHYGAQIAQELQRWPGAQYLRTDVTCRSLRAAVSGNAIYSVFYGPFPTMEEACSLRGRIGADSYVKRLDDQSDPTAAYLCSGS